MDIDSGLLVIIDEYISDALATTGTRRAPRTARALHASHAAEASPQEVEADPDVTADDEPEAEMPAAEPAEREPQTEPYDEYELGHVYVIDEQNADAALLAQVSQQLAQSESALEPLPRERAPRSTIDLDDEVTTIMARPDADNRGA